MSGGEEGRKRSGLVGGGMRVPVGAALVEGQGRRVQREGGGVEENSRRYVGDLAYL